MAPALARAQQTLPGPGDQAVQEQQRRQGQLVRRPRELSAVAETPFGRGDPPRHPFIVTRQIFTGAGKVGSENGRPAVPTRSPSAPTSSRRRSVWKRRSSGPIVNTRDEPHGDPGKYRRLHVIIGDANLSEYQTFLKLGVTALFLAALEDGALPDPLDLADPVDSCWQGQPRPGSRPSSRPGRWRVTATALEIQCATSNGSRSTPSRARRAGVGSVLSEWERYPHRPRSGPRLTADRLDWVAKRRLLGGYVDRDGLAWDHAKAARPSPSSITTSIRAPVSTTGWRRGSTCVRLFTDDEVEAAVENPPDPDEGLFPGSCVSEFPDSLVAANWDSLVFDTGEPISSGFL
jgi:Pup amidohydrolase